ncbi:hypothetical protein [Nocardioides astragali]|uniref:DUF732 domain-containing protein n=1 Tax=Nocardioides astragali TaxID=1776736 RepID=A0ABW2N7V7_9ACTN|nr:hypothetical protein [Nocardioides astragali]
MPTSTDRSRARLVSRAAGVVAVLAVAAAVFVLRPVDDGPVTAAGTDATTAPPASTPTPSPALSVPPPASATDEEFCAEFRRLAESQGQFVSNGGDTSVDRLRASADALVATGVPDAMSLPARSGYYTLISGVYDSIGLELAPEEVGAPGEPVAGGDAAFASYMGQYCPP